MEVFSWMKNSTFQEGVLYSVGKGSSEGDGWLRLQTVKGQIPTDCGHLNKKWSDTEPEDKSLVYVLQIFEVNNCSYNC
jgi:hypothetical protein